MLAETLSTCVNDSARAPTGADSLLTSASPVSRTQPNIEVDETAIRDPLIGHVVLGYRISRRLGEGGMGLVYEAVDASIGRKAAIKVLRADVAGDEQVVARFRAEAKAANAAKHRGIVDVFGFVTLPDGREAIVMEFLEGLALEDELRNKGDPGLPVPQALGILDEIAAVLVAAHSRGVIHRDLKSSNVFLCDDDDGKRYVKVLDFGIAKTDAATAKTTVAVMGTPDYMSPEQAAGRAASPSMDLYSLGCIAFELLTGRLPFQEATITALLLAHQSKPAPAPSRFVPALPGDIDRFVQRLLAKRPEQRFKSASEVREAVAALLDERPTAAPRRGSWVVLGVTGAVVLLGVVVVGLDSMSASQPSAVERGPAPLEPVDVVAPGPAADLPSVADPTGADLAPPPEPTPTTASTDAGLKPGRAAPPTLDRRRAVLKRRLSNVAARMAKLDAESGGFGLELEELRKLETVLSGAPSAQALDGVEVAAQRLEGKLK
ncbi:MAG: serine/threonine-protein kinase [Myxococcaceae bacterium]|nr:serine/threonine-protein kinase [Myxococcaceae bacterium]